MARSSRQPFSGLGVSLITLFHGDRSLDAPATARLAARLVEHGVRAVVVADVAGESAALTFEERNVLLDAVRKAVPTSTGVAVIAGTGAPSSHQAARYTKAARDLGADAVVVLSPPHTDDPRRYYGEVLAAAGSIPVIAQHDPHWSWPGIDLPDLLDLPVHAYADSSNDPPRLLEALGAFEKPIYVGADAMLAFAGPLGCTGAMVALANAQPERCAAALDGDGAEQRALTKALVESQVSFPEGIKMLTARRFGTSTVSRMG